MSADGGRCVVRSSAAATSAGPDTSMSISGAASGTSSVWGECVCWRGGGRGNSGLRWGTDCVCCVGGGWGLRLDVDVC
jgi:hypothetical protein